MRRPIRVSRSSSSRTLIVRSCPVPGNTVIWRYVPFVRFLDIIKTHTLWFSRPFSFADPWEGLCPPSYILGARRYAKARRLSMQNCEQDYQKRVLRHRYAHFVSCWHISEHESDAMWRLYGLAPEGIAIRSTVGDCNACLGPHNCGKVIYYDFGRRVRSHGIFGPSDIVFKRLPFSWEREFRFWLYDDELLRRIELDEELRERSLTRGCAVPISDMGRFISKIVVAPGASDAFIEHIRDACAFHRKRWLCDLVERSCSDWAWSSLTHVDIDPR